MRVYLRKSISAGPFRFNLSKSGIGVSAGVKGLRVGSGPRGTYVHAGRHGVYYRHTIGGPRPLVDGKPTELPVVTEPSADDSHGNLEQDVHELVDAAPTDLVQRLTEAAALKKPAWFTNPLSYRRRKVEWQLASACPVFYDLDDPVHDAYGRLLAAGIALGRSPGCWYDASEVRVDGAARNKGNAGAGISVDRTSLRVGVEQLPTPSLNLDPLAFTVPRRQLIFLPDQLLVHQGAAFATVGYAGLSIDIRPSRFVTNQVPAGVKPIDRTWQYVNAKGGPDLRYKTNPEFAVLATWEMDVRHEPSGFEFHTAFTDQAAVAGFAEALKEFAATLPD